MMAKSLILKVNFELRLQALLQRCVTELKVQYSIIFMYHLCKGNAHLYISVEEGSINIQC